MNRRTQPRLFPDATRPAAPSKRKRDAHAFDRDNRAAARIILADPKYRGVMQEWAEMVMERIKSCQMP